jgi:hypothetical protein
MSPKETIDKPQNESHLTKSLESKVIHLSEDYAQSLHKGKRMPQKLKTVLDYFKDTSIPQFAVPPITGLSTWFGLLKIQGETASPTTSTQIGIAVVIVTLLSGIITGVIRLKLGQKELDITQDANASDFSVKMMNTLNEALKQKDEFLRANIKERDEFWSKRVDFVREQAKDERKEMEEHNEAKMNKLRDEKHDVSNLCTGIRIKYGALRSLIETQGHLVRESDSDINIIWNAKKPESNSGD